MGSNVGESVGKIVVGAFVVLGIAVGATVGVNVVGAGVSEGVGRESTAVDEREPHDQAPFGGWQRENNLVTHTHLHCPAQHVAPYHPSPPQRLNISPHLRDTGGCVGIEVGFGVFVLVGAKLPLVGPSVPFGVGGL